MSAKTNKFKIGLFALLGAGLLVTALLVFGVWSNLEKKSLFETYVAGEVGGLSVGSAVELRGVRVGQVTSIGFSSKEYQDTPPGYVVVVFEVNDDISDLPPGKAREERLQAAVDRGLRARPKAQGVTGNCIVSLEYMDPVENPPLKIPWTPRNTYIPSAPGLLGDLLVSMQTALHKLNRLDVSTLEQLAQTDLKSLGRLLERINGMDLEGMGTNTAALLTEVRTSNAKIQTFIADTDDTVKKMQLEKLTRDADAAIGQVRETLGKVHETLGKLEPGLANIDFDALNQTLINAHLTLDDADAVMRELKRYPSGFIFGKPPPPIPETQPVGK